MRVCGGIASCLLVAIVLVASSVGQNRPPTDALEQYSAVRVQFQNPPAEFSSAPFWVWNDRITRSQIDEQMADFRAHGIQAVILHPRPGLITPYLSDEWLALCHYAVDVAQRLGMKLWLYDENSYPSGFAGGHVPAQIPDAPRTGLRLVRLNELPQRFEQQPVVVLEKTASGFSDITAHWQEKASHSGEFYVFDLLRQMPSPWHGGFTYVDLMRRDVTEKFLEVTLGAYKRNLGSEFGKAVPGVFQDEAEIGPQEGEGIPVVNYTPAMFARFQAKWNYDLKSNLPSLYEEVGDWRRVRHDFYATLLDLFLENWAKPYSAYCAANHLACTGHFWEHDWPLPVRGPDTMAAVSHLQVPGIDILMNRFQTDSHAQFGNARAVKEIRSIANQLGRTRTLSETFGAGGWEMTFFDQKRIADWEYALGVNLINQHLSYVSIKGARKRDHPLSFSYHEPWWPAYKLLADYYARLSAVLSAGAQSNDTLVLEPTTTAWMFYAPGSPAQALKEVGERFQAFVNRLEAVQVEYDLGSEAVIREHGSIHNGKFRVGQRDYSLVVLPPAMENLDAATLSLLRDYLAAGGRVLDYGDPPRYVDGQASDAVMKLASQYSDTWLNAHGENDLAALGQAVPQALAFQITQGVADMLFHHRRTFRDFELVFLANTDSKTAVSGTMRAPGRSCEQWDAFTGKVTPSACVAERGKVTLSFQIPPGGSVLLALRPSATTPLPKRSFAWTPINSTGKTVIRREDLNVLTLDYCDLTLGNKTEKDLYFYAAQRKVFQFHGLDRDPWDSAVQYKTAILDKDHFAPDSGFTAEFRFTVAAAVNKDSLRAVVEQPQLYRVFVNGSEVRPLADRWWLDKAFGVFDIGRYVQAGGNTITLRSAPFTIHTELEAVYLLGDFALASSQRGFTIVPPHDLAVGSWVAQGLPFYGGGVSYTKHVRLSSDQVNNGRLFVTLGDWNGVVADVRVNGKSAGYIAFAPFELDVADHIRAGDNEISVVVYGSLKNPLGPHHGNPPLGQAWPGAFQNGAKGRIPAGAEYSVVDYGLRDDFTLALRSERFP